MDELQTLKRFRADVAPAALDDPVRERTMVAIRTLIEQEMTAAQHAPSATRGARILSRRRLGVVALIAAAIAVALAVIPTRRSSASLVGEALAAIGSGSVLHVRAEQPTGRELLDLSTGKAT